MRQVYWLCAQLLDVGPRTMDLFLKGNEDPLPPSKQLHNIGVRDGAVLFMLQRAGACVGGARVGGGGLILLVTPVRIRAHHTPSASRPTGWYWEESGSRITLSENSLSASAEFQYHGSPQESEAAPVLGLATGGAPMTEGRHYWEVQVQHTAPRNRTMVGAVRPGLDHSKVDGHHKKHDSPIRESENALPPAFFIDVDRGGLHGNGKRGEADYQSVKFESGDRVGVLLDLDAGWMRFYFNGERYGAGFRSRVTGPLVRAVQLRGYGGGEGMVTIIPGVSPPEDAGTEQETQDCLLEAMEKETMVVRIRDNTGEELHFKVKMIRGVVLKKYVPLDCSRLGVARPHTLKHTIGALSVHYRVSIIEWVDYGTDMQCPPASYAWQSVRCICPEEGRRCRHTALPVQRPATDWRPARDRGNSTCLIAY